MRLEKRILIVDDDDAIRALLVTVLKRRGYELDTAQNGAAALEKLAACRYSLVILDLMMPHLSGYDVLKRLSGIAPIDRPLVLVLTAGGEQKPFAMSFVIGMIHKPFDVELILDTVAGCMRAAEALPQFEECPPFPIGSNTTN